MVRWREEIIGGLRLFALACLALAPGCAAWRTADRLGARCELELGIAPGIDWLPKVRLSADVALDRSDDHAKDLLGGPLRVPL